MNEMNSDTKIKIISLILVSVGILILLCAIIVTPDFVEKFLSPDNQISPKTIQLLQIQRLIALIFGCLILTSSFVIFKFKEDILNFINPDRYSPVIKFRPIKKSLSLTLSIILGFAGILLLSVITSKYGAALSPDSTKFISVAQNLLDGNGYIVWNRDPAVFWPPLFPSLIAMLGLFGIEPLMAVRYLNTLLFGIIIFVTNLWLMNKIKLNSLGIIGAIAIFLSFPVIIVSKYAWTEPLFILLVLLFLILMERIQGNHKWPEVVLLAIIASLACLTRYIGITLILFYLIILILSRVNVKQKILNAFLFTIISVIPILLWLVRNYTLTSTLTGQRNQSANTPIDVIYSILETISYWYLPSFIPGPVRIELFFLFFVFIFLFLLIVHITYFSNRKLVYDNLIILGFITFYLAFLATTTSIVATDKIGDRLLSPIYIPLCLYIFITLYEVVQQIRWPSNRISISILLLVCTLWLALPSYKIIKTTIYSIQNGAGGYSSSKWQNSELIAYLKNNSIESYLYSNDHWAVYILAEKPCREVPRKHAYRSPQTKVNNILQFQKVVNQEYYVYVAWFNFVIRNRYFSISELKSHFDIDTVVKLSDGVVYRVMPKIDIDR